MSDSEAVATATNEVRVEKQMQSPKKDKIRREEVERMVAAQEPEDDIPPAGEGLSDEVYEVAEILDHLYDDDGVLFFTVRWKGYGPDDDSLEPAENLTTAAVAIADYWDRNKGKERKTPARKNEKTSRSKKSTTPKASSKKSTDKGKSVATPVMLIKKPASTSRSRGRKTTVESGLGPEKSPSPDTDGDKDGSYQETPKKTRDSSKTLSKGALKAYDDAPLKNSNATPLSSAKKAALQHRSTWLFDDDISDDSDDEDIASIKKRSEEKNFAPAKKDADKKKELIEQREHQAQLDREVRKRKAELAEEEKQAETVSKKKVKAEISHAPEEMPMDGDTNITGSRVLGIIRKEKDGPVMVCIEGKGPNPKIMPLREAYEKCGFGLVEYLVGRMEFH